MGDKRKEGREEGEKWMYPKDFIYLGEMWGIEPLSGGKIVLRM